MSPRKREFNFDDMLGTSEEKGKQPTVAAPVHPGIQETVAVTPAPSSPPGNTEIQEPVNPDLQEPSNTGSQVSSSVGLQESGNPGVQDSRNTEIQEPGQSDIEQMITGLLFAHAGLRTGTAKKATFDFTPEFARALKRWSADTDVSMRDLVVRAVAMVIPEAYLREPRTTGIQGYRNTGK